MLKNGIFLGQRYEIINRIGSGGMADVYKARDHKLNRFVAIKVLKREFREDSKFVSKFRVEAQSAAGLMHPNIVNVYDVADEQGISYMVMELVEGITLKDYIEKRGQLSAKEAISISIQVASGIECAHKNHIVHRDIKPQNIIISREGKVKVTDFGIARAASANTISSNAMGSVHYTSPEQARGGYSDFKSDIYSLGITMYEMLTGRVPFDGDSTVTIAIKHLQEEMELPSKYAPDMPSSLEQIILKCCQKSPDRRYGSMEELIGDLKQSLVNPNGNFVVIPMAAGSETVLFNPEEMENLRNSFKEREREGEYVNRSFDDYDSDYTPKKKYKDSYSDYSRPGEDDYDGYQDEYTDKDVNPGMEKVMKILMIVAAVIMAFLIVFFVGKAVGIFKFGPNLPILLSEEQGDIEVPNFVGMTFEEAEITAASKGLAVKKGAEEESDKYDTGYVTKQDKKAGEKVKEGTTISLTISSGLTGDILEIPNVVGMTQDDAEKALSTAGFKVESTFEASDSVAAGTVISQNPAGGSKAGKNATITIVVSTGTDNTQVPSLVGMTKDEAVKALNQAGLSTGTVTEEYSMDQPVGTVLAQGTEAGATVAKGSAIALVVSKGDAPLEEQVWQCNSSITLPATYDQVTPVEVILTQEGIPTVISSGAPISNPYVLQTIGIPGCATGTVEIYISETGDSLGTAPVTFQRVK